jgi:type I restriction enzyme M protein
LLTDTRLRSQVDELWDTFWTGGLNNPLDAIEQFSYLLFMKRLDEEESSKERRARQRNEPYEPTLADDLRWSNWQHKTGAEMLSHIRENVFPELRKMGGGTEESSFALYMQNAEFKINTPNLLVKAVNKIEEMKISKQNQDVQGDLYEYLLSKLNTAGRNGQFRTPRHIIRMMVEMLDPKPGERIGDLAAGTCGFLVNPYQYILEQSTSEDLRKYDESGDMIHPIGDLLTQEQREFLQNGAFRGYDNDSGMTMLRIGSMNMMLHGLLRPRFYYQDTLSTAYDEPSDYDVILMNPPFKGAVDKDTIHEHLQPASTKKSELLFLWRILRALDMGGRCAVIVPDGVLFGSSNAHVAIRKKLIEENRLDGVISMPSGVFKPYAGVSTAVLLFTKGGTTEDIFFYDMAYDGFSLDDKRNPTPNQNDTPDILDCWGNRHNSDYLQQREAKLSELQGEIAPLHARRLELEREINRLKFESAIANRDKETAKQALDDAQTKLDELFDDLNPLNEQIDSITRFFWVNKAQVADNKYDLSASRYRDMQQDEVFYEEPIVTAQRIKTLEKHIADGMDRILGQL